MFSAFLLHFVMAECWRRRAGRNTACSDSVGVLAPSPPAAPRVLRKQNPRFCLHGRRGLGGAAGPSLPPWPRQQRPSRPAPLPCGHHGAQGSCGGAELAIPLTAGRGGRAAPSPAQPMARGQPAIQTARPGQWARLAGGRGAGPCARP